MRAGTSRTVLLLIVVSSGCLGVVGSSGDAGRGDGTEQQTSGGDSQSNGDPVIHEHGPVPTTGIPIQLVTDIGTNLPPLPELTNVRGFVRDDAVQIEFDPIDDAQDYRIYELPADTDISEPDGILSVAGATYRCAGLMQTSPVYSDDGEPNPYPNGTAHARTQIQSNVGGYARNASESTLGHVFLTAGPDRVPVWALGDPSPGDAAAAYCYEAGWQASRIKTYTASSTLHDELVAAGWRDDGIAFYAPATSSAATQLVYNVDHYYFTSAAERSARGAGAPAADFIVLKDAASGTKPLKRVYVYSLCGEGGGHDELVAGAARFQTVLHQGSYPLPHLLWSDLTEPTILVVEALQTGCPYQGMLAASHIDAKTLGGEVDCDCTPDVCVPASTCGAHDGKAIHEAYVTIAEMRDASSTGEVFINGQYDTAMRPTPIARSFIQVEPQAPPQMDFYDGFHSDATFTYSEPTVYQSISYDGVNTRGAYNARMSNDRYDISVYELESFNGPSGEVPLLSFGTFLGQLWVTYGDAGVDVNGKFRLTPKQQATLASDSFVHATLSIDSVTTRRRYPQIIISDQFHPVQETMRLGHSIVVQPIISWPPNLQIQFCDLTYWDVNHQCDYYALFHSEDSIAEEETPAPPIPHFPDHMATDRANQYDVYLSTSRVYLFFDGQPYGCADLPTGKFQPGPASVTFGDVLYHSGADIVGDLGKVYPFHHKHLRWETRRHYDSIGFSSGVAAPTWDETLVPCRNLLKAFDG